MSERESNLRRNPAVFSILVGGSIAGALDITYAIVFSALRGVAPERLLQTVASGLLGTSAYEGGVPVAALGFLLHFLMTFAIAAIFYIASRRLPLLTGRPVISGMLYGLVVFAVMNFIVLPLSAFPHQVTFAPLRTTTDLLSHTFFVGVPIALAVRRAAKVA